MQYEMELNLRIIFLFLLVSTIVDQILCQNSTLHSRSKRKASNYKGELPESCYEEYEGRKGYCDYWLPDKRVVFIITGEIPTSAKPKIRDAAKIYNEKTCLDFIETESYDWFNQNGGNNGIQIVSRDGCWSKLGKVYWKRRVQDISLGTGCHWVGTVIHEFGHALGFNHEQKRPDRSRFIRVLYENIGNNMESQFDLVDPQYVSTEIPYDFNSVMHYSRTAFTKDGSDTMVFTDPDMQDQNFGNADDLFSFYDLKWLNSMYQCAEQCGTNNCEFEGYKDKHCTCQCPEFIGGATCNRVTTGCGAVHRLDHGDSITISSPNYPSNYPNGRQCAWAISSPKNTVIKLTFGSSELQPSSKCEEDYVELRYFGVPIKGPKYCGTKIRTGLIKESVYNHVMVVFKSDDNHAKKGFTLTAKVMPQQDCESSPCQNGGVCKMAQHGSFYCTCATGTSGERCQSRDGGFGEWSDWSPCPGQCALAFRSRKCDNPPPTKDGFPCQGDSMETKSCGSWTCPGTYYCAFNNFYLCGATQYWGDNFDWGPEYNEGSLSIIEAKSQFSKSHDKAMLLLPTVTDSNMRCLRIRYRVKGDHLLVVNFYAWDQSKSDLGKKYWNTARGKTGEEWKWIETEITGVTPPYSVVLEGLLLSDGNWNTPIQIDEASISQGYCTQMPTDEPPTEPPTEAPTNAPTKPPNTQPPPIPGPSEDCRKTVLGTEYTGKISKTKKGHTCQRWDSQSPHSHAQGPRFSDGTGTIAVNYCRNPDSEPGGPWCYTTDSNTRWDYCDIPYCDLDCKRTELGTGYSGKIAETKLGFTCQRWDSQSPHSHTQGPRFSDGTGTIAKNYCRNPDSEPGGPWCYTTDPNTRWQYCDVPLCPNIDTGDPTAAPPPTDAPPVTSLPPTGSCSAIVSGYPDENIKALNRKAGEWANIFTSLKFDVSGKIERWRLYTSKPGYVVLGVWRNMGGDQWKLMGKNKVKSSGTGVQTINVADSDQISVESDDVLGVQLPRGTGDISPLYYEDSRDPLTAGFLQSNLYDFINVPYVDEGLPVGEVVDVEPISGIKRAPSVEAKVKTVCDTCSAIRSGYPDNNLRQLNRVAGAWANIFTNMKFDVSGRVVRWRMYTSKAGDVVVAVWRNMGGNLWELIGKNKLTATGSGVQTFQLKSSEIISVEANDVIGLQFPRGTPDTNSPLYYEDSRDPLTIGFEKSDLYNFINLPNMDEDLPVGKTYEGTPIGGILRSPSIEAKIETECGARADTDLGCREKMLAGECTKNPGFMLVKCRKSCGVSKHECHDKHVNCQLWKNNGYCSHDTYKSFMDDNCRHSCGICSPPCFDNDDRCNKWSLEGECEANPTWMLPHCQKSCKLCKAMHRMDIVPQCTDEHPNCEGWALAGECLKNAAYMSLKCKKSCGMCDCTNDHEHCEDWAKKGECTKNPTWMKIKCRRACGLCCTDMLDQETCCRDRDPRCPVWAEEDKCQRTDIAENTQQCKKSCFLCRF